MRNGKRAFGYAVGFFASIGLFSVINYRHFHRPVNCSDCFFPYGVPFTFYQEGGFAGGAGFVWTGVIGDLIVVVAAGIVLGWAWTKIFEAVRTKL
ncbi:MAG TPA: hypothetical protein VJ723_08140 [Candidatus Angelobacter sp.]|nr:hypothetical protein [Candidatus Angelobacter sp.]